MRKPKFNTLEEALLNSREQKEKVKSENAKTENYFCENCKEKLSYQEVFFGKKCLLCARNK